MPPSADQFFALSLSQKEKVHFLFAENSLSIWNEYAKSKNSIKYRESICGTTQIVDIILPDDAFNSAKYGKELSDESKRYQEPIIAMQDLDLEFPENISFAYYSIYNLFNKYALNENIDDWLIINQSIASIREPDKRDKFYIDTINKIHDK